MSDLGTACLLVALGLACFSLIGSAVGSRILSTQMLDASFRANYVIPLTLVVATASLVRGFVTHDFSIKYVADHSNTAMESQYIWVAFYAGNEGSLLYIALALSLLTSICIWNLRGRDYPYVASTNAVLMVISIFFLGVLVFLANPFGEIPFPPTDGQGINPLLTHPGMFIHPPVLMLGLISFSIPYAIGMGTLISGGAGDDWVDAGRRWGLFAWAVLGVGLLLGAWWAYTILGWGGYWAWDPVENAGFMPWIAITGFIHSIMVQKRRGMFRMWNLILIILSFGFAQFGMFLNRGGPVPSVHSFGQSTLGWIFLMFMAMTMFVSIGLFLWRYKMLKSDRPLESMLSRESAFLINNLFLLSIAFVTLWGVIFPLISEVFIGETITVGQPFYNQVNGPLFLGLIFLMGVAPYLPWRRATWGSIRRSILIPAICSFLTVGILLVVGITKPFAVLSFSLCVFVTVGILQEWARGTAVRHRSGDNYVVGFFRLVAGNRPRYGGYIVHLAVILLALGVTGSSFYDVEKDLILSPGESGDVGDYTLRYISSSIEEKVDRSEMINEVEVFSGNVSLGTYYPQRDFYPSFRMASTRAAIRSTALEDLYIVPGELLSDGTAIFSVRINPLVMWMWVAGPLLMTGVLITLWPEKSSKSTYSGNVWS